MIPFLKMHGCGNDFLMFDARQVSLPALNWSKIADRHFGVGCDQVIIIEPTANADVRMRIFNADGSEVSSCGNASRCVAWILQIESNLQKLVSIETRAGIITANVVGNLVTMDMGIPRLAWNDIPLAREMDTLHLPLVQGPLSDPVAVSMGNPHAVFFVDDVAKVPLEQLGPVLERDALFPERANIGVAQIINKNFIRLRVWERGSGLTLACGTGACAALVAATLRGFTDNKAEVELPGGKLAIEWRESDNHILMTGPIAVSYQGSFDEREYGAL